MECKEFLSTLGTLGHGGNSYSILALPHGLFLH